MRVHLSTQPLQADTRPCVHLSCFCECSPQVACFRRPHSSCSVVTLKHVNRRPLPSPPHRPVCRCVWPLGPSRLSPPPPGQLARPLNTSLAPCLSSWGQPPLREETAQPRSSRSRPGPCVLHLGRPGGLCRDTDLGTSLPPRGDSGVAPLQLGSLPPLWGASGGPPGLATGTRTSGSVP